MTLNTLECYVLSILSFLSSFFLVLVVFSSDFSVCFDWLLERRELTYVALHFDISKCDEVHVVAYQPSALNAQHT